MGKLHENQISGSISLCTVWGCFHTTMAELSSCDTDLKYVLLYSKSLQTPVLDYTEMKFYGHFVYISQNQ